MMTQTKKGKVFTSKKYGEVLISKRQEKAFENLLDMNFHSEVRVALAEIFNAPKYIKTALRNILDIHKVNNCLDYNDIHVRNIYTTKLNNFIERNYGVKAYKWVLSFQ